MSTERRPHRLVTRAHSPVAELGHLPTRHVMSEIANGNARALPALYDEFAPTVFGIIRQVLKSSEQSEKVTERAFVEIWRTASQFDPHAQTLRAWICAVAHRHAVDELRRRPSPRPPCDTPLSSIEGSESGSARMVIDLTPVRVDDVHGQLDRVARRSIELAYYAGLTCNQIATALGVSPETVRHSIRSGLQQMRNAADQTSTV